MNQPETKIGIWLLICGGRTYDDYETLAAYLDAQWTEVGIARIIHGGANGADALAARYAVARNIQAICYPADWQKHGRAAGPIRNQYMLDNSEPDRVLACPGGRGTADMVARARRARIPVDFVR